MMERLLLIKYGEIHLKGLNRPFFKRLLRQRLLENMQDLHCRVQELHGRVFVTGFAPADEPLVIERCIKTFGVVGVSPAAKVEKTLEAIGQAAIAELQAAMQRGGQTRCTFKVKARREDKTFSPNSDGINREIGGMILQALPQTRLSCFRSGCSVPPRSSSRRSVPGGCSAREKKTKTALRITALYPG